MSGRPDRIVLTRASESNRPWRRALEAAGVAVLVLPLVRFDARPLPRDLEPGTYDWILFTSPQGVRAFCDAGLSPGGARVGALGGGTAAVLAACGLRDDLGADTRDGAGLARVFRARIAAPARVLLPGPETRLPDPRATLETAGFEVTELPLYRTTAVPASELPEAPFAPGDVVFFCSPSAVAAFTEAYAERPPCVAIGTTTAVAARAAGFPVRSADEPSLAGMAGACNLHLETES